MIILGPRSSLWCDLGHGRHPWVVVSSNYRSRHLDDVLAARIITTPPRSPLPTRIELSAEDPVTGWVNTDDLVHLYRAEDLGRPAGALGVRTMAQVNEGLKVALGLS